MTDLEGVIRSLLFRHQPEPPPASSVERLGDGALHVDYHDPDHVYLVTVSQVPRIRLPLQRPLAVGEVGGVRAQLVQVALANHIEVTLDAEQGPSRQAGLSDFLDRYENWGQRADPESPPPQWPAEAFTRLIPGVSDDIDTPYRLASGQAGGSGTEWEVHWSFLPTPPVEARLLTLRFSPPSGTPVKIDLPLPPASAQSAPGT
ncbi:hypothetical protein OG799_26490 [Micromonospora sp. NBC_00898]|uniref:hypothetical protein n=1 Tax=Micromonospora sp. NBC_00898 TaxID=2975981 RepID=UPI00386C4453|nr:hypothetical protein OG799_26490 [Micromonospora sp. NBC_00898]